MAIAALLAQAEAALGRCSLSSCVEKAREAVETATRAENDPRLLRRAHSLLGIGEHLSGRYASAQHELSEALDLAEAAARRGEAHDAYVDIVGSLVDLAANSIQLGDGSPTACDDAAVLLRRGGFMIQRAYRPSQAAQASLLQVSGLLYAARGDHAGAFDKHQAALQKLCLPGIATTARPGWRCWSHAAIAGSVSATIAQGQPEAASLLAAGGVSEASDPWSAAIASSNAAIAQLEVVRHAKAGGGSGERELADTETAGASLHRAAAELGEILGEDHPSTRDARENAATLLLPCERWTFRALWQPAMGAGLADV
tara:strand:- start:918 stop:1859 length:942 start_codon:yes stop_codon:yes gene_type:complete